MFKYVGCLFLITYACAEFSRDCDSLKNDLAPMSIDFKYDYDAASERIGRGLAPKGNNCGTCNLYKDDEREECIIDGNCEHLKKILSKHELRLDNSETPFASEKYPRKEWSMKFLGTNGCHRSFTDKFH